MAEHDLPASSGDHATALDLVSLCTAADPWGEATQWSLIERAADVTSGPPREEAWRELIERYRDPVERSLRRQLAGHPDTEECVQEFFGYLFSQNVLPKADASRGRFRQYIQGVIRNFARVCRRGTAVNRRTVPGNPEDFSLGGDDGGVLEVERAELQDWCSTVLANALARVAEVKGKAARLLIEAYGLDGSEPGNREELAAAHETNEGNLNVYLFRARKLLREKIVEELKATVSDPSYWAEESRLVDEFLFDAYPGLRSD